jgi:penicillin amidase
VPYLAGDEGAAFVALLRAIRDRPKGWVPDDDYDELLVAAMRDGIAALRKHGAYEQTWSDFGARTAKHPLAGFGIGFWNGIPFPGLGGPYSPHVQAPANAQSYRAVWDVGNWKAGGIVIPQGESGEPGSPHYRDAAPIWLQGDLVPLPFDDSDVAKVAEETLTL